MPSLPVLFASLLGYNPVQSLLGSHTISQLSPADAHYLTGHTFFPALSGPFHNGLLVAFGFAIAACLVAAGASWLRGGKFVHEDDEHETPLDFAQAEVGDPEPGAEATGVGAART